MSFTQTIDQPHISSAFSMSFKVNSWAVEVWQTTDQPHTLPQYQLFPWILLWQTTDQPHTIINFFHEFYSDKQLISHTPYQLFPCLLLEQMTDQSHTVSTFSMTYSDKQLISHTPYQLLQWLLVFFWQTTVQLHTLSAFSTSFKVLLWQTIDQSHTDQGILAAWLVDSSPPRNRLFLSTSLGLTHAQVTSHESDAHEMINIHDTHD